ncbi:MAG: patatin-like phospholipase family protein, partial [Verrucomicrobiota bacterium]
MTKPEQCWDWETHTPKNFRRPRVGLVLSSGAAKGLAHIGVIQVFEETGIPVHAVAGASMGAYVGGLWAAGQSGVQLEELALSMKESRDRLELIDPVFPPRRGFIRGDKIANRLRATLGETNIENLPRDLSIIATELESFRRKVFREGDLVNAIRASIAIPGICVPYTLDGIDYVDGGIA